VAGAVNSAELLRRKRRLLRKERQDLEAACERTRARWVERCRDAEAWGLRSAVLGTGRDAAVAAEGLPGRASVEVRWVNSMGVVHARLASVDPVTVDPARAAAGNAALAPAARAYGEALEAAADHAVNQDALRRIEAELAATQRRLRGIERHRIPELEAHLAALELRLEELEREERVAARWVLRQRGPA